MKLIIHRGAQGIEGNCIEISTSTTRIILDAGLPLDDLGDSPRPRPRPGKALPAGLAPIVPGLFGPGPKVDAILLSHAHADHAGLLAFARKGIPILMSDGTRMMLKAASIFAGQPPLPQDQLRIVGHRERFVIGDLTITAFPVDHSTFDCLAFVIDGDEKRVVYSGDLRLHGRKPGMAKRLLAALKERPVDVLLMEGTNIISEGRGPTEVELEAELLDHIKSATGLVLASFSPLHVDRMVSFYKATRRAGRTLVVDLYGAFVLHLVNKRASIPRPGIRNGILVCYNQHFLRTWKRRNLAKIHDLFLRQRIDLEAILAQPDRFVFLFRPSMLDLDFGGRLPPARCIYSYWHGYLQKPEWRRLESVVKNAGGEFVKCHTSGHAFAKDLIGFGQACAAKRVVPIHTTGADKFRLRFRNVVQFSNGEIHSL